MRLLIPLFSPATGTWGGMTRMVAIAHAAQQAGHQVAFCASGYLQTSLKEHGFTVYPVPAATFFGLPAPISRIIERRAQRTTLPSKPGKSFGNIWFVLTLSGMAGGLYLNQLVEAERMAALDFSANAIFTDLDLGAFILARVMGLPVASAYQSVMQQGIGSKSWKLCNRAVTSVLKAYRLSAQSVDALCLGKEVLKIIPSIPALDGEDPTRPDVCYVGDLLGEIKPSQTDEFIPEPGKRYIFVYVGTGSVSIDMIRKVLPQAVPENGALRAVVGSQSVFQPYRLGGVEMRPYVPAEAILPYCDWTICHGGQNTIIQSLIHGVPLIIFPGGIFERRFNASKVQEAGAGKMGELKDFSADWLRNIFASREIYQSEASQLGKQICSYGGANQAIKALEKWVFSRPRYKDQHN